jgi:hypothetical protein
MQNQNDPYIMVGDSDPELQNITGLSAVLLPLLKDKLNIGRFRETFGSTKEEYRNKMFRNASAFHSLCNLLLFNYEIIHPNSFVKTYTSKVMTFYTKTYPVYYSQYGYTITKGLSYTPMEKLLLPFDLETWIMIIITFAIGFLTIFIIYRCNRFVQRFVFGTFIRDPSLNLTSIFFGIGVTRLPGRNFARYLFMIFTLYCLIIRTAYQGKMFEFLNTDVKRPTAKVEQNLIDWKIPVLSVSQI